MDTDDAIETEARALWAELLRTQRRARPRIAAPLDTAQRYEVDTPAGRVTAWRRGDGPAVLLSHGWADDHNLWAPMIQALIERGHAAVTFDFPGHGLSGGAELALHDGAKTVRAVAEACGPIYALVAHSFGCPATALALAQGLPASRAVFIAAPGQRLIRLKRMVAQNNVAPAVFERVRSLHAERFGPRDMEMEVAEVAPGMTLPALFIHSSSDETVPVASSERAHAAWPGSQIWITEGPGHRQTARDAAVIKRALDFLEEERQSTPGRP